MNSIIMLSLLYGLLPCNTHLIDDEHDHGLYHGNENEFEKINEKAFYDRVIGYNYTSQNIFGEPVKYYITKEGYWHLDACSVIGKEGVGLMGTYRRLSEIDSNHRRLNPYQGNGWPSGNVYYVISHPSLNMVNFNEAIAQYNAQTPIRIYQADATRIASGTYINVTNGNGCWSFIGMTSRSGDQYMGQTLSLGGSCSDFLSTIMHEFGHALGLYHTQQRSDRNSFVNVFYQNIMPSAHSSYDMIPTLDTCGDYTCDSMMHYTTTAFRNCTNCVTMEAINPSICTIQRNSIYPLSTGDKACLCQLYEPNVNGNSADCATPAPTKTTTGPTTPPTTPTSSPTKLTITPTLSPTITGATVAPPSSNGFCISGTAGVTSTFWAQYLTGYWEEKTSGSTVYYELVRDTCQQTRYIVKVGSTWGVVLSLSSTLFYATCNDADVYNCNQKWTLAGTSVPNTGITQTSTTCSYPTAPTIKITGSSSCDGDFEQISTIIDVYTYENPSTNFRLKYNDMYEYWICYYYTLEDWVTTNSGLCSYLSSVGQSPNGIEPINVGETESYIWTQSSGTVTISFQGLSGSLAKGSDGNTVNDTKFKFSAIQWGIFAFAIIGILIINIVVLYFIVKRIKKKLSKELELKQTHNNGIQKNIQVVPFDDIESNNIGIDGIQTTN